MKSDKSERLKHKIELILGYKISISQYIRIINTIEKEIKEE